MGYYLADVIYPPWAQLWSVGILILNQISKKRFAEEQSKWRKVVKRSFSKI
jgi:hypothetical protein